MKVALACSCSTGYVVFLNVLLKSILKNNPDKQYPFFVFCHKEGQEDGCHSLMDWDRYNLKQIYPWIEFVDVDQSRHLWREGSKCIKYYSLEAFGLEGFDKVIYFGADMLNVKSLDSMINFEGDLCMTREDRRRSTFNNGGMIIGKKYLSKQIADELVSYKPPVSDKYFGTDQALLCHYFEGKITEAPRSFNCLVTEPMNSNEVVNWHYIIKPTTSNFVERCGTDLLLLWQRYQSGIDL